MQLLILHRVTCSFSFCPKLKKNADGSGKKLTDIARSKTTFFGHVISSDSYGLADRNVLAIKNFPTPNSVKEVKACVGTADFFREFIANFALIAAPLYALLKHEAKFVWGAAQKRHFNVLERPYFLNLA